MKIVLVLVIVAAVAFLIWKFCVSDDDAGTSGGAGGRPFKWK